MGADAAVVVFEPVIERAMTLAPILRFLDDLAIPHLVFVNKMDRTPILMRDLLPAMQDVSDTPLLATQVPIRDGETVTGYVDLVTQAAHAYSPGAASGRIDTPESARSREQEAAHGPSRIAGRFRRRAVGKTARGRGALGRGSRRRPAPERGRGSKIAPVLIGSAEHDNGVRRLLRDIVAWLPEHGVLATRRLGDGPPAAQVSRPTTRPMAASCRWRGSGAASSRTARP